MSGTGKRKTARHLRSCSVDLDVTVQLKHPRWKALLKPYCETVREACGAALAQERVQDSGSRIWGRLEMAVVLADDKFIRQLNRDYRGKDKPTNVLAFPSDEESQLGDVVLALETIEREAREQKKTVKNHTKHLLVHGTLHLLGYDHERKKDAAQMEALEIKILETLGVANPYL